MSTTSTPTLTRDRRTTTLPWALVGLAGAAIVIAFGNIAVDHAAGENGGSGPALVTAVLCVALTGLLFLVVLRRSASARTRTVLAALSVLSLAVFWTGAPAVLGAATAAAARRPSGSLTTAGWIGLGAGGLAVMWSVVSQFI